MAERPTWVNSDSLVKGEWHSRSSLFPSFPFPIGEAMLRKRPIRARIYQIVTRYGVVPTDLKYIIIIAVFCWAVPMVLMLRIGPVPLFPFTGLAGLLFSYAFFYWIRIGKPRLWLKHQWQSLIRPDIERAALPTDRIKHPKYSWLK
jgi:hypothetical protein